MAESDEDMALLIRLAREYDLDYLDLQVGDIRLRVTRGLGALATRDETAPVAGEAATPKLVRDPDVVVPIERASVADGSPVVPSEATDDGAPGEKGLITVTAPLIGIFYSRPEPGADPFCRAGDAVTAGSTLALLEVMKMFSPVQAPAEAIVAKCLAADGDMVEYGQALFLLQPQDGAPAKQA